MAARFHYNFGILRGDDFSADPTESTSSFSRYQRNLSFRNILHELSANLEISFLPERAVMKDRPLINGYVVLRIILFRPQPAREGTGTRLSDGGRRTTSRRVETRQVGEPAAFGYRGGKLGGRYPRKPCGAKRCRGSYNRLHNLRCKVLI